MKLKIFKLIIIVFSIFPLICGNLYAQNNQHVLLVGIDGVSSDGFQYSQTPNINQLLQDGAISLNTRAMFPTESAPNWASHLSGAGPEQTGVTDDHWLFNSHPINPTAKDNDGYFPTIFNLIRNSYPDAKTGMFYDWDWLGEYVNIKMVFKAGLTSSYMETTEKAIEFIRLEKPLFTFVYYGTPDNVAQISGYQTIEYFLSINKVDSEIGKLIDALKEIGIYEQTNIIIVSERGGMIKSNGNSSLREIDVPWIISGPGIIKNKVLQNSNTIINTAPTIAYLLGLNQPEYWTGRPMKEAFEKDNPDPKEWSYVPKPQSSLKSAIFFNTTDIKFSSPWDSSEIRYTLDGIDPTEKSILYSAPFTLITSSVVKAACFFKGSRSEIVEAKITIIEGVERFKLFDQPDKKYSSNGELSLLDGIRGTTKFEDGKWLGFEGYNLTAIFRFTERKKIGNITIGCLQDVANMIFFPAGIEYYTSDDGEEYKFIGGITKSEIMGKNLEIKNFEKKFEETFSPTYYLKIVVKNTGTGPAGTPAAGKKVWLFVDEITLK